MNTRTFSQSDSRWGKLAYPSGKYQMHNCGCGCCACTFLIIQRNAYKNYTPKDVRPYMVSKGYAVAGHGTKWAAIKPTLEHYGLVNVINHPTMASVWKQLAKQKNKLGVILFRKGSRGGVTWSSVGHFVAFIDYKVENNKHYFLVRDSGSRHHNGWYCYETTMQGLIPQIWTADLPAEKKGKTYSGTIPSKVLKRGSKGTDVKNWQKFLNWYFKKSVLSVDGSFGPKTLSYTKLFQSEQGLATDGICGPKTQKAAKVVRI